ncbi:MAG: NAD(+) diphosphatase, partial [Pseudomonadota bacterium]
MRRILNAPPHVYAHDRFDRAALQRRDELWLASRREDPETRVILVSSGLKFQFDNKGDAPQAIVGRVADQGDPLPEEAIFLGVDGEIAVFALPHDADHQDAVDLREHGPSLPADQAGLLAYARALVHWHGTHRFCGHCGSATRVIQGGHARLCTQCARQVFPRTDPAVIVLVLSGRRCLMARSARFLPGMYSTLAGFVEPGESLEMTVRREVFEEVGVRLDDLSYRSSQPWPFPQSLMICFHAEAASTEIRIDEDELEDAGWYSR